MDIKELKNIIESGNIDFKFLLFLCSDDSSNIIIKQYYTKISNILNLEIKYIESLDDIPDNSFIEDNNLYILRTNDWSDKREPNRCIVICNKTNDNKAIKFPKLEDWQVVDYAIPKLPGVENERVENLIKKYNKNYFRFLNDVDKISIFNKNDQNSMLDLMINDHQFKDLSSYTIWDLSNAIIKRDLKSIISILNVIDYIDVEALWLAKVLYSNFKNIVSIQTNSNVTYKDLGISDKQFFVIKRYNCGFYSNEELIKILKLLTDVEILFKYNDISISDLIDYLICNIIGV